MKNIIQYVEEEMSVKNIIQYVEDEKAPFAEKPFSAVDSLVLSQLSYFKFDGFVPELAERSEAVTIADIASRENAEVIYTTKRDSSKNQKLLAALAGSPRFSSMTLNYYVNKLDYVREKQFSAVTYFLSDNTAYVAFRGTDSTFVGWKEDFNMAFSNTVPSQEESVVYLDTVGKLVSGSLKVGGHSKGGNLAVYAAMKCASDIQERITDVFSHDGPGFREEVFQSIEYQQIKERIRHYIPQTALVGMLMEHHEKYAVVKSRQIGIMQHDPYSWVVKEDDFQYLEDIDTFSAYTNKVLGVWLDTIDDEKRELFIDSLYSVIEATGAKSFSDLSQQRWDKVAAALNAIRGVDEETRRFVTQTMRSLIIMSVKNLRPDGK